MHLLLCNASGQKLLLRSETEVYEKTPVFLCFICLGVVSSYL